MYLLGTNVQEVSLSLGTSIGNIATAGYKDTEMIILMGTPTITCQKYVIKFRISIYYFLAYSIVNYTLLVIRLYGKLYWLKARFLGYLLKYTSVLCL